MIDRRAFVTLVARALLLEPLAALAQQTGKIYRIGYLNPITSDDTGYAVLRGALANLGYVSGKNTVFEERFADRRVETLPSLAAELVAAKVDVIIAAGPLAIRAAQGATSTIPIVMAVSGDDPVKSGFVASLAHPGGNITGLTALAGDLAPKQLELLREAVPGARHVAVLFNANRAGHVDAAREMQSAARSKGVQLDAVPVRGSEEYSAAFVAMTKEHTDAILILADPMFTRDAAQLAELALKHALPSIYQFSEFPTAGGLMSYGPHHLDTAARAATYVDKILHGASPAELPVQQPTKFELALNLKTAKALNLRIPPSLLLRANEVIR